MKQTATQGTALPANTDELVGLLRTMLLSRAVDDEEIRLKKANRTHFNISGAGHEAIGVAAAFCLKSGHDWVYPYYRDRAFCLQIGMTPREQFLGAVGAAEDPNSGSRQMPCHWGAKRLNMPSHSSPTATQFNHAVGCAEASRYISSRELDIANEADEIVYVSSGEGATAEGEFWEALNVASNKRLPILFMVQDNEYAISVPVEVTTSGGDIAQAFSALPGLKAISCDGTNLFEALDVCQSAVEHIRNGHGPVLLRARVTRPYSHSLSDDQQAYRAPEELATMEAEDCLRKAERLFVEHGLLTRQQISELREEVRKEAQAASAEALKAKHPRAADLMLHLYSDARPQTEIPPVRSTTDSEILTLAQSINRTLLQEMERDERIVVFGQDVADVTRKSAQGTCKGKGGVFKVTHGLQTRFGSERVYSTLLSENSILGRAVGMATRGLLPVPEIQFLDFVWFGFMHLRNEFATMRWRSAGEWTAPAVIRIPSGGYVRGGGIYHAQSAESIFVSCPGLQVVYPSNAADAMGLLRAALRGQDPVVFLEHKALYYQSFARSADPGTEHVLPFGRAAIRRTGGDATIVTWGAIVQKSIEAADRLKKRRGIDTEVIDLRTVQPVDMETIYASVRRTGRLLIAHEEFQTGGFGGELAARVAQECFEWLDAPIRRVASRDVWVAYAPELENAALLQTEDVEKALEELISY